MRLGPTARRRLSLVSVVVLVAGLVVLASRSQGFVEPEPDLHDSGIWVTNEGRRLVGRTNAEIAEVDTKLSAGSSDFDVLQSDGVVLVHQEDPAALSAIDPATSALIPGPELPGGAEVALGAGTAALLVPDSGSLYVVPARTSAAALGLDPSSELEPVHRSKGSAAVAVGVDGLVHLYDGGAGVITTWSADGTEVASVSVPEDLDEAVLTAVGERPVLLAGDQLIIPGRDPVAVDLGGGEVVQEPGPEAEGVLVAGADGLDLVRFSGTREPVATVGTGSPARPVRMGGCTFGAWGGDPTYVQACDGADPVSDAISEMDPTDGLRFRTNRQRVTLNDLEDGSQLLFGDDDPVYIDNEWAEALSDEIEIDPDATEEIDEQSEPTCESPENGKPVAEPDVGTFGTRRDRPVVVYPLRNDQDPDCDVLLISDVELEDEGAGTLGIIDGGRAVQVDVASDVDELRFDYTVTDGRGGRAKAAVSVDVVPDEQNDRPVLGEEQTSVVTGGTVTHNVLATGYDPDGDVLRLLRAEETGPATGTVKANSRGDISYTAGNGTGDVEISYVVGDGRGGEQTGVLAVDVVDRRENQPPDARNDATTTFTGREVVFDVLDNDTDPNGDELSIVRATSDDDANVRWDPTSSEIRVEADRPGTVNVVYRVTDGQSNDEAVLRVDVQDRGEKQPPVAVRDDVFVTGGEPAYVPVLDNDVDPDGEVLVVLGMSDLPEPSPISVTVIQRSVLKITAPTALTEPVELSYRISDGTDTADGRVLVEPAPTTQQNRPPVVAADEYTVRAGGIVTFPVLSNDSDPDGDGLSVEPPPADQPQVERDGRLYLDDAGLLRYEAPDQARGSVRLIYSARDTADNVASAEIVVHVLPADPDRNQPPVAPELVGRTVAGQEVTIPVPISTMDPDGDTVTLLGIDDPPRSGTVTDVGPDALTYVPDDDAAGTDEFTYRVVDQFGDEATATVLVGIARRPSENNAPIPTDDQAVVRAGATVTIPVLANDFDPDADPLVIATDPELAPEPTQGTVEIDGAALRYTAPSAPVAEQTSFRYTADDGRGGTRSATVTLTFRDEADNRPPVAADDVAEPQSAEAEVELALLDNDSDPDQDDLRITGVTQDGATVSDDGRTVSLVMPDEPVQFTYVVSDGIDDARAAVSIPLIDADADQPPIGRLDDDVELDVGESVDVDVLANDEDPEGEDLHLLKVVGVRHGSAKIDGDRVRFTASEDDYVGDAGFSYVVGDDSDPSVANTTVASVRVRIDGDVNSPPEFTELSVELPQGGERELDLERAVTDADPDDEHEFSDVEVTGDGFDADLDDGVLTISADSGARSGASGQIELVVSDGEEEATGTIQVRVVGSDEPLATVGADATETFQGDPVTIDVLANDSNPFPETPLEITQVGEPSSGGGTARAADGGIVFTPADDFFGETSFPYTVADATGDPGREVSGTVTVTVVGRPSAPPAPTCIGGESRSVRVQWSAPGANGAPITGYVVRVSGSGSGTGDRTLGNGSTQDITGLTNGARYTFQVAALNAAVTETGADPNFSPPSPSCTPDQVPGQPAAPVTAFGDRSLRVHWQVPANEGSPIEKLILTNTTSGASKEFGPTVTETTWTGLENGTNVRFTLTAENALGKGPTSPPSTGDGIPAGVPSTPAAPDASPSVGARDGFLDVRWTWSSSQQNGDAVKRFRVTSYRNGARDQQVVVGDPSARSQTFRTANGEQYRFTVEAENKAGWSKPSAQSAVAVSAGKPLGTYRVTATEGDTETTLTLDGTVDDNGASISRLEYDVNGSGTFRTLPDSRRITGLANGQDYRFRVRAVNSEGNGAASQPSNQTRPYGAPSTPKVSASVDGRTIRWSWTASNGNGRAIDRYQYNLDGNGWVNIDGRSYSRTFGYSETHTLRVRAVSTATDAARKTSGVDSASAKTVAAPNPVVEAYRTGTTECDTAPGSTCTQYNVRGRNLPANTTVTGTCQFRTGTSGAWGPSQFPHDARTNGSGSFTGNNSCHVGTGVYLRFRVQVNGNTYYTSAVTK